MPSISEIAEHRDELVVAFRETPFIVFLCGPSHPDFTTPPPPNSSWYDKLRRWVFTWRRPSAELRKKIWNQLKTSGIEVVLGEDEGLLDVQLKTGGLNAQDNELIFIKNRCNAVVLIADSVGSFCELGLFSWHFAHGNGELDRSKTDFILLVDERYRNFGNYFNEGPARAVGAFGLVEYVNFANYDFSRLVRRLNDQKGVYSIDRRGRPRIS